MKMWSAMSCNVAIGVVASFALVFTGCIIPKPKPGKVMVAPDVRGRVVDAVTGKPVAGAHVTVASRPETLAVSGEDGRFHVEQLYKKYAIQFIDPGGVIGYCPPLGEIVFRLDVTHPACQDLQLWIREHLAESPANYDGPFVMRDVRLIPRDR